MELVKKKLSRHLKVSVKLIIDTHLLLWAAADTLPPKAIQYFENEENKLLFSSASIWEIVIKKGLKRSDFKVDPAALYIGLLENGYSEIPVTGRHTLFTADLPAIHKDPFDRILIAQARAEGARLLTADRTLSHYPQVIWVR